MECPRLEQPLSPEQSGDWCSKSGSQGLAERIFPTCGHTRLAPCDDPHAQLPLTAPVAAATAGHGIAALLAGSTPARSTPLPSLACKAANVWPSPCRWSAQAAVRAGVSYRLYEKVFGVGDSR